MAFWRFHVTEWRSVSGGQVRVRHVWWVPHLLESTGLVLLLPIFVALLLNLHAATPRWKMLLSVANHNCAWKVGTLRELTRSVRVRTQQTSLRTLCECGDGMIAGKLYRYNEDMSTGQLRVEVYISFGGLLMLLKVRP